MAAKLLKKGVERMLGTLYMSDILQTFLSAEQNTRNLTPTSRHWVGFRIIRKAVDVFHLRVFVYCKCFVDD